EAGHPVPDKAGEAAAREILQRVRGLGKDGCSVSQRPLPPHRASGGPWELRRYRLEMITANGAPCSARTLRTPLLWKRSSSAGGHLNRRRAVGQVHRVGHRDEHFARSLEALPAVRGADVVYKHQVTSLPRLACGVCLVDLVDQLHDVRVDRVAVAEAGIERQSVLAVDVHEVLAHLRVDRPLVEECDLVEPAPLAGERVTYDGAAALPGAQSAVGLPFELDRVGTAVTLAGATVVGAKCFSNRRADFGVVGADEQPTRSLEALDQLGGQLAKYRRRVRHRRCTPVSRRNET